MGPAALVTSTQKGWISPVLSFPSLVQCVFEKCVEAPARGAISCCSNIPVQFSDDDRLIDRFSNRTGTSFDDGARTVQ